jgi:Histidine phosphatase superfamily (branch 2)
MSGQALIQSMLEPVLTAHYKAHHEYPSIPVHTADRNRDIVAPNDAVCPQLAVIQKEIANSHEFALFNHSKESEELRAFTLAALHQPLDSMDVVDCLMTTMCTDRPLPTVLDDYSSVNEENNQGTSRFRRLYDWAVQKAAFETTALDGAYSKLAMTPLWSEIRQNLDSFISNDSSPPPIACCPARPASKFALYAGHDGTIMPLLASLGLVDEASEWPPYASMVALELHAVNIDGRTNRQVFSTNFAFRLIYNGKVLTSKVRGCSANLDLCDAKILLKIIDPFSSVETMKCDTEAATPVAYQDSISRLRDILSTTEGIVGFISLVGGSIMFGAVCMFFYLTGTMPTSRRRVIATAVKSRTLIRATNRMGRSSDSGGQYYDGQNFSDEEVLEDDYESNGIALSSPSDRRDGIMYRDEAELA